MEWNWPMGSSVGWAGWAGPAGQLAKEKIRKKKIQKKIRQKVCMSLGCRTGEMGCASQSPRNPAPLQDAVPTAHCPIVRHECIMYSTVEYMYRTPSAFRLPPRIPSTEHPEPQPVETCKNTLPPYTRPERTHDAAAQRARGQGK